MAFQLTMQCPGPDKRCGNCSENDQRYVKRYSDSNVRDRHRPPVERSSVS